MDNENKKSKIKYNHLINEKSPYLIQHKENPVDWYPWSDKAFEKAKNENKPIFLSIGYSTCHWCHVMAHESFEDPEISSLMNKNFVNIKVDREERPDLDNIYMTVCQMITGSGGWPLTIIMTPDKKPFFAGTYFPKESHYKMVGLKDLILNVREMWNTRLDEINDSADTIIDNLQKISDIPSGNELEIKILDNAYNLLLNNFDDVYGGFGEFPKFPTPHNLLFLLRYWKRTGNEKALSMVVETLDSMGNGGIYDHIGFGFHRYSVDKQWLVPHFEKMLYDQALISMVYIEAFQAKGYEKYKKKAFEIFDYIIRDMQSPEGGFYSAEDADSEGVEGKFYLWSNDEIFNVLEKKDAHLASKLFNITVEGNFTDESTGKKTGVNILHIKNSIDDMVEILGISKEELEEKIEKIRNTLFNVRRKRLAPHKDDKILTDWNGLMIASLAKGAQVFSNEKYLNAAVKAADFIIRNIIKNNRLYHRFRDSEAVIDGHLDDYAFLIYGFLELYEASFDLKYLKSALSLNKTLLDHFWDNKNGGFYFTPEYKETVLLRKKEIYDGAIPSGNSIMMLNLLKLSIITENEEFKHKALNIEKVFSETVARTPNGFTQFLSGLDFKFGPSYEIVIAGNPQTDDTNSMLNAVRRNFIPNKTVVLNSNNGDNRELMKIIPSLEFKKMDDYKATAYICSNNTCKTPTTNLETLLDLLNLSASKED
ncbi:MAG: thioredoxin domain-containing protein [Methanobacterium sp.]|uniref:thioredoxin domain-containing protein n=1 Tax=Methanobacterium sp. TaxID=2164 RepID=UPI003D65980A|nr:thioredoxin domain-containing protein [Methanobacterium sp.]